MKRIVKTLCCSVCMLVVFGSTFIVSAGSHWSALSGASQANAEKLWKYLVTHGYSEIAAAGILGNCNQESTFTPTSNCNADGSIKAGSEYAGAFQIAQSRWKERDTNDYLWWIENKLGKKWDDCWSDITVQMQYIDYSCSQGYRVSSWKSFVEPVVQEYSAFKEYQSDSTDRDDIEATIRSATGAFCAGFEGCLASGPVQSNEFDIDPNIYNNNKWQELKERKEYAIEAFDTLSGTVPLSSDGTGTSDSDTIEALVSSWLKSEYNEEWGTYARINTSLIELPDGSGLSGSEREQLYAWKEVIESEDDFAIISFLRTCVAFIGILLVIYSTLIYLAYWVDRVNNFIEFSCLNALTMGRLVISPDDSISTFKSSSKKVKSVVHRDIIFVSLAGITLGIILLSGRIYLIIDFFIEFAKDVLK